jgi:predicted alpha/beta-fold hydrolase
MQSPYILLLASWLWAKYASNLRQLRSERSRLPSLSYHNTNTELRTIIESNLTVLLEYKFSALLGLLDYYGEYQGVYTMFMRKVFPPKPEYDRELLKLKDGGTVGLDWLQAPGKDDSNVPIVILQHGLCGHTYSHYMKGQPEVLTEAGLYVCSFVARGCGGVPLTTPETFTAARTNDFRAVVQYIAHKYPDRKIAAVGYSLGAG